MLSLALIADLVFWVKFIILLFFLLDILIYILRTDQIYLALLNHAFCIKQIHDPIFQNN